MSARFPIVDTVNPTITIASVERFYLNLVICLQLDIALFFRILLNLTLFDGVLTMYTGVYLFPGHSVCYSREIAKFCTN